MLVIYLTLSLPPSIVKASVSAFMLLAFVGLNLSGGGELVEIVTIISPALDVIVKLPRDVTNIFPDLVVTSKLLSIGISSSPEALAEADIPPISP